MPQSIHKTAILIIFIFLYGCELFVYEPEGEHYVDLSEEPGVVNVFWEESGDTIGVWQKAKLHYNFSVEPQVTPLQVFLYLDGTEISSATNGEPLKFNSYDLEDGIYKAYLILVATSGTESLADRLRLETTIAVDSTKHIWVDNGELGQVAIKDIKLQENGSLKIEWEKYQRPRFARYEIRQSLGCSFSCIKATIDVADSTTWVDLEYDGHPRSYWIWTKDFAGRRQNGPRKYFETSRRPSSFVDARAENCEITFSWTKSVYPLAFDSYSILRASTTEYPWDARSLVSVDDLNQTQAKVSAALGSEITYYLGVQSKSAIMRSDTIRVPVGLRFPNNMSDIGLLKYNEDLDQYFAYDRTQGTIALLDASNMEILSSNQVKPAKAPGGRSFTYSENRNQFVVTVENLIKVFDTNSLKLIKTLDLNDLYPSTYLPRLYDSNKIFLNDNGVLWYTLASYQYPYRRPKGTGALDLDSETLIEELHFPKSKNGFFSVHPEGKLFYARIDEKSGNSFYKFEENSVISVFSPNGSNDIHIRDDGNYYYQITYPGSSGDSENDNPKIEFKPLTSNRAFWSVNIGDISTFTLDKKSNRFSYVSKSEGGLVFRSLNDGSIIEKIDYPKVSTGKTYYLTHDIIWLRDGYYSRIENMR